VNVKIMDEVSDAEVQKLITGLKSIDGFMFSIESQFFVSHNSE
jgi:hypothetical protein